MSARRLLLVALLLVCGAAAGVALWRSGAGGDDPVARLAAELRCPACQGETVADSHSPVADAMRAEIGRQLASGRTPEQVEDFFVRRYGPEVLADPSPGGAGALLWVLPGAVLAGVLALGFRTVRRRRPAAAVPVANGVPWLKRYAWGITAAALVALVCGVALAAGKLAGGEAPAAAQPVDPVATQVAIGETLEAQGRFAAAAQAYQVAWKLRPDAAVLLRLAFAQLRAGQPAEAGRSAGQALTERPGDENALLVLGLAQRAGHDPAARQTLEHFLALAPGHPAAAEVRRLLAD
ncbi:cytochrome c-type biogenesis protein CcmH [Amycolatopsis cynarae]|uniref:Cytochrome c-type biogenesis protein n=1 Tax=Amycolatopsis cynarae TaxID=2995223 RepID=A0ABY7BEJ1_9PSEU|nr:cytochrome c-type biogenesis protein CcmH [Amycolatopsis sp. HUAS 11-8]WAL69553.1 cytochrome c-type biogenesis protein CcmH [Amycolatopsis sp. HUAS 11-8]